jgi:hypothetical protein
MYRIKVTLNCDLWSHPLRDMSRMVCRLGCFPVLPVDLDTPTLVLLEEIIVALNHLEMSLGKALWLRSRVFTDQVLLSSVGFHIFYLFNNNPTRVKVSLRWWGSESFVKDLTLRDNFPIFWALSPISRVLLTTTFTDHHKVISALLWWHILHLERTH